MEVLLPAVLGKRSEDGLPKSRGRGVRSRNADAGGNDENRFVFSEDYVRQTRELFKTEVLPAYPKLAGLLGCDVITREEIRPEQENIENVQMQTTEEPKHPFYIMHDHSVPPSPTAVYTYDPFATCGFSVPSYEVNGGQSAYYHRYDNGYSGFGTTGYTNTNDMYILPPSHQYPETNLERFDDQGMTTTHMMDTDVDFSTELSYAPGYGSGSSSSVASTATSFTLGGWAG